MQSVSGSTFFSFTNGECTSWPCHHSAQVETPGILLSEREMLEQTVCFDRENSFAEGLFYHSAMGWTIAAQNIVFMCPGEYAEQLCNVHRGHNI